MSTSKPSKSQDAARAALMIVGVQKHFANVTSLTVAGVSLTPAQITASLQTIVDLRQGANDARAAMRSKVAAERSQAPALRSFMSALVTVVRGAYGTSPDVLADFGLAPKKARTPLTVEQKAAATAKREATRAARHTMGPKQRSTVKGDVTGVVVTPVKTAPATPASPAPATGGTATAPAAATTATSSTPAQGAPATPPVVHA